MAPRDPQPGADGPESLSVSGPETRSVSGPETIFVYGTLRAGQAPPGLAGWLARLARRPATLPGRLLDLGAYPGAVLAPPDVASAPTIVGELVEVPASRLPQLDRYEGYDPEDRAGSLFLRARARATPADGRPVACWVYVWAGPTTGREVPGGDWLARRAR